jgi:hypothetical protein
MRFAGWLRELKLKFTQQQLAIVLNTMASLGKPAQLTCKPLDTVYLAKILCMYGM